MRTKGIYWSLTLLAVFFSVSSFAKDGKILIVNSDSGIFRYGANSSEFKSILQKNNHQWIEFNLAEHANNETELQNIIQQENPELIYCIGTNAYALAHNYAKNNKLLFSAAINWRRLGVSHETYGITNELSTAQELALLRYFFPEIKSIGLIFNEKFSREYVDIIKKEASAGGIRIINQAINDADEIDGALDEVLPEIDMFWIIPDPVVLNSKISVQQIFKSAQRHKKPVYAYSDVYIEQGAALTIAADPATVGRQAASLALTMSKDKNQEGIVQNPAGSIVIINKCVLDKLDIKFNKDTLDSVNKVVECDKNN